MTKNSDTSRSLPLLDGQTTDSHGCGCGSCGCDTSDLGAATAPAAPRRSAEHTPTTHSFAVTGLTCGHCVGAVTSNLMSLEGVTDVHVELTGGGTSTVSVVSDIRPDNVRVDEALAQAGNYQLA